MDFVFRRLFHFLQLLDGFIFVLNLISLMCVYLQWSSCLHLQEMLDRKRGQGMEIGGTKRYCVDQPRPSVTTVVEDVVNLSPSSSASLASAGMYVTC